MYSFNHRHFFWECTGGGVWYTPGVAPPPPSPPPSQLPPPSSCSPHHRKAFTSDCGLGKTGLDWVGSARVARYSLLLSLEQTEGTELFLCPTLLSPNPRLVSHRVGTNFYWELSADRLNISNHLCKHDVAATIHMFHHGFTIHNTDQYPIRISLSKALHSSSILNFLLPSIFIYL